MSELITESHPSYSTALNHSNGAADTRSSHTESLDEKADLKKESSKKSDVEMAKDEDEADDASVARHAWYPKYRPFILAAVALVILGWWISSMMLTRYRWYVELALSCLLRL